MFGLEGWLQHEPGIVYMNFIEMRGMLHCRQVIVYGNGFFILFFFSLSNSFFWFWIGFTDTVLKFHFYIYVLFILDLMEE